MCELKFYYFLFPFVHESDEEQKEKKTIFAFLASFSLNRFFALADVL